MNKYKNKHIKGNIELILKAYNSEKEPCGYFVLYDDGRLRTYDSFDTVFKNGTPKIRNKLFGKVEPIRGH